MKKFRVVLICTPEMGNLVPLVEFAHLLTNRDRRFCATVLIMTVPERPIVNAYVKSRDALATTTDANTINFVYLPSVDPPSPDQYKSTLGYLSLFIEKHKPHVKNEITKLMETESDSKDSDRVAGLFIDMFCTSMIDVANQLGIPCYLYFASPASFLGFMLHFPNIDAQIANEFVESNTDFFCFTFNGVETKARWVCLVSSSCYEIYGNRRYCCKHVSRTRTVRNRVEFCKRDATGLPDWSGS